MPGPEANTEYHWVAFARLDLPKLVHTMSVSAFETRIAGAQQPVPVGVHALVQRLVVEQLGVHSVVWIFAISAATTRRAT